LTALRIRYAAAVPNLSKGEYWMPRLRGHDSE
jgi:hypothetical protein